MPAKKAKEKNSVNDQLEFIRDEGFVILHKTIEKKLRAYEFNRR